MRSVHAVAGEDGSMSLQTFRKEKRAYVRWRIWGVHGRLVPDHEVSLLDISEGGALIEHAHPVREGTILFLTLPSEEHQAPLKCRVVRSVEQRYEVWPTGEHEHVYRTGVEFVAPSEASRGLIHEYILAGIWGEVDLR
jgi:hypothetical protein